MERIASARDLFSSEKVKGVSALFSGVSLWRTMVSPPSLAGVVETHLVRLLATPDRRVLASIVVCNRKLCEQTVENTIPNAIKFSLKTMTIKYLLDASPAVRLYLPAP